MYQSLQKILTGENIDLQLLQHLVNEWQWQDECTIVWLLQCKYYLSKELFVAQGCYNCTDSCHSAVCVDMYCFCLFLSYLCSQFFHIWVNLIQDVEALLEKSVLGTHEWQHLQERYRKKLFLALLQNTNHRGHFSNIY